ncbi:MAG: SRPBCC family protein [Actinomycetota bacterium]
MPDLDELFGGFQVVETIRIDASPERAWALITDVERIVDFSPECVKVEWLNGATHDEAAVCVEHSRPCATR